MLDNISFKGAVVSVAASLLGVAICVGIDLGVRWWSMSGPLWGRSRAERSVQAQERAADALEVIAAGEIIEHKQIPIGSK